jgi:hypothetical protein
MALHLPEIPRVLQGFEDPLVKVGLDIKPAVFTVGHYQRQFVIGQGRCRVQKEAHGVLISKSNQSQRFENDRHNCQGSKAFRKCWLIL